MRRASTVTLTGSGWQPGESVHINVNDDQRQTWSRNVDVTADASGNITDSVPAADHLRGTLQRDRHRAALRDGDHDVYGREQALQDRKLVGLGERGVWPRDIY